MSSAAELQKAIFAALGANAALTSVVGTRIFDHAPANAAFPYITFGRTSVYDWTTGAERDDEQLFTLHVWSKAKGDAEALQIMETVRARLADSRLALDGREPVRLGLEFHEARYDDDLAVHHGLLRFRARTEPAAG